MFYRIADLKIFADLKKIPVTKFFHGKVLPKKKSFLTTFLMGFSKNASEQLFLRRPLNNFFRICI